MRPFKKSNFITIIILALIAMVSALILQRAFPVIEAEESFISNIGFFVLININIIVVMILAFIVIRNIIRLIVDRRKNILGARLRGRLVFAFVMLSMVPTVLLFFVAQGLVERVLQDWFSPKVELALESARITANDYYEIRVEELNKIISLFKNNENLNKLNNLTPHDKIISVLNEEISNLKKIYPTNNFSLFYRNNKSNVLSEISPNTSLFNPDLRIITNSINEKETIIQVEVYAAKEFFRAYSLLFEKMNEDSPKAIDSNDSKNNFTQEEHYILLITSEVNARVTDALSDLLLASDEYQEFKSYRRPLSSSYFLTLVVVTLLVIFASISVGFFLARGLTIPIGLLAKGTEQVAHGNLSYKIPDLGDDELGVLVRAFNKMTSDLKDATDELLSRSRYIETVLANVGVGVLSISSDGILKTFNHSAFKILEIDSFKNILNQNYSEVLPSEIVSLISDFNLKLLNKNIRVANKSLFYAFSGGVKHLQIIATKLTEETYQKEIGMVLLLDDVTEFERAQRMSAWQEVARRIAHEIKNPLTPIQLSAERISRLSSRLKPGILSDDELRIIDDSTGIISSHVEGLRVLVNEFSQFARMPKSELSIANLNFVIENVIKSYISTVSDIQFRYELDKEIPMMLIDSFQIERVCMNIIDNAISSVREKGTETPLVIIKSYFNNDANIVFIEFEDNGLGVSDKDKSRMFEPYYTMKKGGTGLGLAIVKTVISDHSGFIRVFDREGGGLIVRIELPVIN